MPLVACPDRSLSPSLSRPRPPPPPPRASVLGRGTGIGEASAFVFICVRARSHSALIESHVHSSHLSLRRSRIAPVYRTRSRGTRRRRSALLASRRTGALAISSARNERHGQNSPLPQMRAFVRFCTALHFPSSAAAGPALPCWFLLSPLLSSRLVTSRLVSAGAQASRAVCVLPSGETQQRASATPDVDVVWLHYSFAARASRWRDSSSRVS